MKKILLSGASAAVALVIAGVHPLTMTGPAHGDSPCGPGSYKTKSRHDRFV